MAFKQTKGNMTVEACVFPAPGQMFKGALRVTTTNATTRRSSKSLDAAAAGRCAVPMPRWSWRNSKPGAFSASETGGMEFRPLFRSRLLELSATGKAVGTCRNSEYFYASLTPIRVA